MEAKRDIQNREDVQLLIDTFYSRAKTDPLIGHFFTEVVVLIWEKHMPTMYDFWESTLFNTWSYKGNPMQKHLELNLKSALKPEHFKQWLALFHQTADSLFAGEKVELAKTRSLSIATMIQVKIHQQSHGQ